MYNWDKFLYGITMMITFRTDEKTTVEFLEIIFNKNKKKTFPPPPPDIFRESSHFNEMQLYWNLRYHDISEVEQFSYNNTWSNILFQLCSMVSWCVAYKCHNKRDKNPNWTFFSLPRNGKIAKIWNKKNN